MVPEGKMPADFAGMGIEIDTWRMLSMVPQGKTLADSVGMGIQINARKMIPIVTKAKLKALGSRPADQLASLHTSPQYSSQVHTHLSPFPSRSACSHQTAQPCRNCRSS